MMNLEQPADFVKNLCHDESMGSLMKRKLDVSENILINENTVFNTEAAHQEFLEFSKLEINGLWFGELVQLVQIHFGYKSLADQGPIELIQQMLSVSPCQSDRFSQNKSDLIEFIQSQEVESDKLKKLTKNHSYFRHQKQEIEIDDKDYEDFIKYVDAFPLVFSVICQSVDFIQIVEEEEKTNSNGESLLMSHLYYLNQKWEIR